MNEQQLMKTIEDQNQVIIAKDATMCLSVVGQSNNHLYNTSNKLQNKNHLHQLVV